MKQEQVLGTVRHVLTFVGGLLVAHGVAEAGLVSEIIGAVIAIAGTIWSIVDKIKKK